MSNQLIIAVDGPAASGKSSIAKLVAQKLNIQYFSSGQIYRAIAYLCHLNKILPLENPQLENFLSSLKLVIKNNQIYYKELELTEIIRSPLAEKIVSEYAKIPLIRSYVLKFLREFGEKHSVIMDGRDIATMVFPNTPYKFYIYASVQERAKRRLLEFKEKSPNATLSLHQMIADIKERDFQDSTRQESPLKPSENAIIIDNSKISLEETANMVYNLILKNHENKT